MSTNKEIHITDMAKRVGMKTGTLRTWCDKGFIQARIEGDEINSPRWIPEFEEERIKKAQAIKKRMGRTTSFDVIDAIIRKETGNDKNEEVLERKQDVPSIDIAQEIHKAIDGLKIHESLAAANYQLGELQQQIIPKRELDQRLFTKEEREKVISMDKRISEMQQSIASLIKENQELKKEVASLKDKRWWKFWK